MGLGFHNCSAFFFFYYFLLVSKQLLCLLLKVWDEDREELQEVTVSTAAAETCLPAAVAHDSSFRTNGKP